MSEDILRSMISHAEEHTMDHVIVALLNSKDEMIIRAILSGVAYSGKMYTFKQLLRREEVNDLQLIKKVAYDYGYDKMGDKINKIIYSTE